MADCYKQYRAYKAVCLDEEPTFDTDVHALNIDGVEKLYRRTVKQLLAARACVQGRKWVKENCYPDAPDEGHDRAIEVATDHVKLIESKLEVIVSHLVQLHKTVPLAPQLPENPSEEEKKVSRSVRRRRNQKQKKFAVQQQVEHDTEEWYNEAIKENESELQIQGNIRLIYMGLLKLWLESSELKEDPKKQWLQQVLISGSVYVENMIVDELALIHSINLTKTFHKNNLTSKDIHDSLIFNPNMTFLFNQYMRLIVESKIGNSETDGFGAGPSPAVRHFMQLYIAQLYHCDPTQVTCFLVNDVQHARALFRIFHHYKLFELSTETTNEQQLRLPRVVPDSQRRHFQTSLTNLAHWWHDKYSIDYVRTHLNWKSMSLYRDSSMHSVLKMLDLVLEVQNVTRGVQKAVLPSIRFDGRGQLTASVEDDYYSRSRR